LQSGTEKKKIPTTASRLQFCQEGNSMLTRPAIVLVDDEPQALTPLLDALARRYGGDYRVVSHLSARAALDDLAKMKNEGPGFFSVIAFSSIRCVFPSNRAARFGARGASPQNGSFAPVQHYRITPSKIVRPARAAAVAGGASARAGREH
jgi:hypothetical protein